jgi:cell division protein FtsB
MKKILYHPLTILAISLLVIIAIFSLRSNLKRLSLSQENLKSAQMAYEKVKQETAEDETLLEQLQQPFVQEKITRNELLRQKDDEILIKLPDIIIEHKEPNEIQEKTVFEQWKEVLGMGGK